MPEITERQELRFTVSGPFHGIKCDQTTIYEKEGKEIGREATMFTRMPGDDISNDPAELQSIANGLWTPELAESYKKYLEEYYTA